MLQRSVSEANALRHDWDNKPSPLYKMITLNSLLFKYQKSWWHKDGLKYLFSLFILLEIDWNRISIDFKWCLSENTAYKTKQTCMAFFVSSPLEQILSLTACIYCLFCCRCCFIAGFFHVINSFTSSSYSQVDNFLPKRRAEMGPPWRNSPCKEIEAQPVPSSYPNTGSTDFPWVLFKPFKLFK